MYRSSNAAVNVTLSKNDLSSDQVNKNAGVTGRNLKLHDRSLAGIIETDGGELLCRKQPPVNEKKKKYRNKISSPFL